MLDKPDTVYVVEGQPASVTVTFNHVEAQVIWRRWALPCMLHSSYVAVQLQPSWSDLLVAGCWVTSLSHVPQLPRGPPGGTGRCVRAEPAR